MSIANGVVNVPTSAGQLTTSAALRSIAIFAPTTNTGTTYIGGDASVTSTNGFPLAAGDTITLDTTDTAGIWLIGTSGDKVRYLSTST